MNQNPSSLRRLFVIFQMFFWLVVLTAVFASQLQAQSNDGEILPVNDEAATTTTVSETVLLYLPIILHRLPQTSTVPVRITEDPPIDFDAARAAAQAQGKDISFNKIGFHIGSGGGNREGLEESIAALDAAGVPVFLKSANDAEPLFNTQQLMLASGVQHILVYRDVDQGIHEPDYNLPAQQVAEVNWQANKDAFPPELDPTLIWLETINEPDWNRAEWLAEFSLAQAKMAVAEDYKYAAFSWSSGVPEPEHWESPAMLEFLRYAGEHPENVAVALHEYSFITESISNGYPWLVGRFQKLFAICDKYDIPRPTVLITEWGWAESDVPSVEEAMEDIAWASWLYAAYPQVKGAAIWYLGPGFGSIAEKAQKLIDPVRDFSVSNYYVIYPDPIPIDESIFAPNPPTYFSVVRERSR